jgi:hypothetical protein
MGLGGREHFGDPEGAANPGGGFQLLEVHCGTSTLEDKMQRDEGGMLSRWNGVRRRRYKREIRQD